MAFSELKNIKIVFITSIIDDANRRNLNDYQRIYFLSRSTDLTIIAPKNAEFQSPHPDCVVCRAPLPGKSMLLLYGIYWLARFGKNNKIDAILTEPSIVGVVGFFGRVFLSKKWIVDIWDIPFRRHSLSSLIRLRIALSRAIFKSLYKFADLFLISIVPDFALTYFHIDNSKMLLLNNAIWIDESQRAISKETGSQDFAILCTRSAYTKDMGLDILAEAFVRLKSKLNQITLVIVGEISKTVRPQLQSLVTCRNVILTGFVDFAKWKELITGVDICVVPFRGVPDLAQTYPTSILQYFVLGKPIVASRIAGIQKMIDDGVNGLLFNAGDVDDLAAKIELLYKNRGLRERIAEGASKSASKYDCREKNRIIVERIDSLVNQNRS